MQMTPLSASTGVRIDGLDLAEPPDAATIAAIAQALYDHRVVCISGQEGLSPEAFQAFGARFGAPLDHPEKDLQLAEANRVLRLSNAHNLEERQVNGGNHWHTDLVFTDEPASFTMLHAVAVPKVGGETRFSDQVQALRALPEAVRDAWRALTMRHCYEGRTDGSFPTVTHPLIRAHPVTGVEAIYGAGTTPVGIEGMRPAEALALIDRINEHATSDAFQYEHRYTLGDVVIWDNAALLHCGPRLREAEAPDERRIMHRVSVRGWPAGTA